MITLNEVEILERARTESSSEILERVFQESRPKLLSVISNRVGPTMGRRVNPSDVLQEAYISASKKVDQYLENPSIPIVLWVQNICCQVVSVFYRRHFMASKRSLLVEEHRKTSYLDERFCDDSAISPSGKMMQDEEQEQVFHLVSKMTEADRVILYMRHVEDLSIREAAVRLGIEFETAKKRHARAIKRLTKLAAEKALSMA